MLADALPLPELRRALVIKLRHHGDVLLTSPVFSVLKAAAPQVEIDALVYADTADMLSLHPAISALHCIDRKWKQQGLMTQAGAEWRLLTELRRRRYDLVIHLTGHPRGAWLVRLLRPRFSVAPQISGKDGFWRHSFSHFFEQPMNARRHMVERNLDALRRLGIYPPADQRRLCLVPGPAAEQRVAAIMAQHDLKPDGFIHVHPTSRWMFKCWPNEKMAALIAALAAKGHRVVLTAAPDGKEMAMVRDILARCAVAPVNLAGELSLKELAALTAQAKLFVGVDSAPMHIAAAMARPTLALFGPSGELEWGPWGTRSVVVASTEHACRPCGIDGCGGGKLSDCLATLEVARVLAACEQLLAPGA